MPSCKLHVSARRATCRHSAPHSAASHILVYRAVPYQIYKASATEVIACTAHVASSVEAGRGLQRGGSRRGAPVTLLNWFSASWLSSVLNSQSSTPDVLSTTWGHSAVTPTALARGSERPLFDLAGLRAMVRATPESAVLARRNHPGGVRASRVGDGMLRQGGGRFDASDSDASKGLRS